MVENICKFMTCRSNSHINSFKITAPNAMLNGVHTEIATCYIKPISEGNIDYYNFEILNFNDIGTTNIVNLLDMFNPSNAGSAYLNFLPSDNKDTNYINIIKIKEICAALECELSYVALDDSESNELKLLKKLIRKVIKYHKISEYALKKTKTYDRILGEMKYWNLSLADKLSVISEKYNYILINVGSSFGFNFFATYEDISDFVRLRNNNSHGRFTKVSKKQAETAYWMIGLIYCCVLSRIGLNSEEIQKSVLKILR